MTSTQVITANKIFNTALNSGLNNTVSGFIVEQSAHETNGWQSSLFKRANNGFGMTVPRVRKSPFIVAADSKQPDGNMNYARYNSIEDSTKDLIHWFNFNKIALNTIKTREQYANVLKSKGYYGDTIVNYLKGLNVYSLRLAGLLKSNSATVIIFLIVGIFILSLLK